MPSAGWNLFASISQVMVEVANEFKRISEESKLTCGKWFLSATYLVSRRLLT